MNNQDRFMDDMHFCIEVLGMDDDAIQEMYDPVSYTHLTLPTNREV